MTDQMIPADKVRPIVAAMRVAMRRDENTYSYAEFLDDMGGYIKDLEALLPPRPTLADMPPEERRACRRMQCDYGEPGRAQSRGVIGYFDHGDGQVIILTTTCGIVWRDYAHVTPRPDLPRLTWPGEQQPAPALPDGWRLADHRAYGRVIVTSPTPDGDGHVYFVLPDDDLMGYDWHFCRPAELTYLDQEADQ